MNIKNYNFKTKTCILFYLAFFIVNTLSAQIVLERKADNGTQTINCGSSVSFTDDNSIDGVLYDDSVVRNDRIILCPSTASRVLSITFSEFSVANGDALFIYDGDRSKDPSAPLIGGRGFSGNGVSQVNGGWVKASCDITVNETGCLTFIFQTNNDGNKSTGWMANVFCEDNAVDIQCASNVSAKDDCLNPSTAVPVTFNAPRFTSCGGTVNLMIELSGCASANLPSPVTSGQSITAGFPLGTHAITATLVGDRTKTCTFFVTVDQGPIVCNDNVAASLQNNCSGFISIDGLLENPCYGSGVSYLLETTVEKGKRISQTINATNRSDLSEGLTIDADDFNCGQTYDIRVTRNIAASSCGGGTMTLSNSCTGSVRFDDNSPPIITASAQSITTCGEVTEEEILEKLDFSVVDFCDVKSTNVNIGSFPKDFCNSPSVAITIEAEDQCGNRAERTIRVQINRPTDFFRPTDTILTCGAGFGPDIAGYPLLDSDDDGDGDIPIIDNTCNYIAIFEDTALPGCGGGIKIVREWRVQDWCKRTAPQPIGSQVIEVRDTKAPSISCPTRNARGTERNPYELSTDASCNGSLSLSPPNASDDCDDDVAVNLIIIRNVHIPSRTYTSLSANLAPGKYYAEYRAEDACGNRSSTCRVYFDINASSVPTAVCVDQLNVSFADGPVTINASTLDAGSFDNCSNIFLSVRKDGGDWEDTINFTCAEAANNTRVFLRVLNTNGGENTCWVNVKDTRSNSPCNNDANNEEEENGEEEIEEEEEEEIDEPEAPDNDYDESVRSRLSGKIVTPANVEVSNVVISARNDFGFETRNISDEDGDFTLNLPNNAAYEMTFGKSGNLLNGITIIDLVLIQRHILGTVPFSQAYQYIAADINTSGTVSVFDMVELRKIILGVTTAENSNIPIWRFVNEADLQNNDAVRNTNLFVNLTTLQSDTDITIRAIKTGDLNGNVNPSNLQGSAPRNNFAQLPITLQDKWVTAGETASVPFQLANMEQLAGFQLPISIRGATIQSIEGDLLTPSQYFIDNEETVKIAWDYLATDNVATNQFTIHFQANESGLLSDLVHIPARDMEPMAILKNDAISNISLSFDKQSQQEQVQVSPNPFQNETSFLVTLNKSQNIQLAIFDLQGKAIYRIDQLGQAGTNTIVLDGNYLPTTGMYLYQIQTATSVFSDRIIFK